jgi:hypothetical protein
MLEDCYLFIDETVPEDERTMKVLCVGCRDKEKPTSGWYWKGSVFGYGPFDFVCSVCNHVVYSPNLKNDKEEAKGD